MSAPCAEVGHGPRGKHGHFVHINQNIHGTEKGGTDQQLV